MQWWQFKKVECLPFTQPFNSRIYWNVQETRFSILIYVNVTFSTTWKFSMLRFLWHSSHNVLKGDFFFKLDDKPKKPFFLSFWITFTKKGCLFCTLFFKYICLVLGIASTHSTYITTITKGFSLFFQIIKVFHAKLLFYEISWIFKFKLNFSIFKFHIIITRKLIVVSVNLTMRLCGKIFSHWEEWSNDGKVFCEFKIFL